MYRNSSQVGGNELARLAFQQTLEKCRSKYDGIYCVMKNVFFLFYYNNLGVDDSLRRHHSDEFCKTQTKYVLEPFVLYKR